MKLSSISESDEYAGLEDADEFEEDDEFVYCSRCDVEYRLPDAPLALCENCGSSWCYDCLPGGRKWLKSEGKEKMDFQTYPPIDLSMDTQDINDWAFELLLTCPYCPRDNGFIHATDLAPPSQL